MNELKDSIQHSGRIEKIGDLKVEVNILAQSACSSCHSKGMCNVAEMENKIVEVTKPVDFNYKVGDEVIVYMKKSLGNKAVFYGYLYPFLIMLVALILMLALTSHEGLSALVSLALLVPYYFTIYKLKDKLSTTFEFKIQ
jgi:sigma-E factor negative regulatory protein RseC